MTNHKRPETYHKVRRSTNASPYDFVPIGARTEKSRALFERVQPHLFWDDPFVSGHQDKPWMHDYLMERYQVDANTEKADPPDDLFAIPIERFGRHTLIVGGSGGGKTRLAMHLVREQLRAGCSLVILDYKDETIRQALAITEEVGLAPENVTLIWPRETSYGIPRWNPLLGESSALSQRVNQFVDIMAGLFANSWGPRLEDILRNATTVIAAQGLSLIELMEFLRNETYRTRLLAQAHGSPAYRQHPEQHRYFEVEFASMSKADKATAVNAVTNKLRVFTTTEYFRALFCDNQQNLNLESLWNRQQVILVHLDTVTLGEPGIRALVGLLTNALYAAALSVEDKNRKRETKPVPVLLTLDELETQERYAGKALTEILNKARSYHLRLLGACQYLDQLSPTLRGGLLTNTAVRAFFRLGGADARIAAPYLSPGFGTQPLTVTITTAAKVDDLPVLENRTYYVVDEDGVPLAMEESVWEAFVKIQSSLAESATAETARSEALLEALEEYKRKADYPLQLHLVAKEDMTGTLSPIAVLKKMLVKRYTFQRREPLSVLVRFPRPKAVTNKSKTEEETIRDIANELEKLPPQHAIVKMDTGETGLVRVIDIHFSNAYPSLEPYLLAAKRPSYSIRKMEEERLSAIEALSAPFSGEKEQEPPTPEKRTSEKPVAEPRQKPSQTEPPRRTRTTGKKPSPGDLNIPLPTPPPEAVDDGSI